MSSFLEDARSLALGCVFEDIDAVFRKIVRPLTLNQSDIRRSDRPQIDPLIGPRSQQIVETPPRRARLITRADLKTDALVGFLDDFIKLGIPICYAGGGHY